MIEPPPNAVLAALLAGITTRAAARDEGPVCLAVPFPLTEPQIEHLLAHPGVASLALLAESPLATGRAVGSLDGHGDWRLPNGAYRTLYFAGSPLRLTRAMLREAARHGVRSLACQMAGRWVTLPLGALVNAKTPLRWLYGRAIDSREYLGRWRGRATLAMARRWPATTPAARWLAGPVGLGGSPLEASFRALLARNAAPRRAPAAALSSARIVLVCGSLSPGGAERQVAMTAAALKAAGVADVRLLCHTLAAGAPHHHDFYRARAETAGVLVGEIERVHHRGGAAGRDLPRPPRGWLPEALMIDVANLRASFDALRPDVVHAWLDWDGVRAGLAAVLAGVPRVVISGRNLNPSRFVFHQPTMRPAYRALIDHPSVRFLNNSRAGADDYARWLGVEADRIQVIANAVAFEGVEPPTRAAEHAARARLGLPLDALVIGGVFRLAPEKRPLLWLDMAAELARRRPDARFVLHGAGPLEAAVRARIAALDLGDRVILAGVTDDVVAAMAAMDVVVLTSEVEGLPNVILEAQALGRPVVTTRAGGVAEAMRAGVTGLIVDAATPGPLADAVERALSDTPWRARARALGPPFIHETFSVARMVKTTLDVYDDVEKHDPRVP